MWLTIFGAAGTGKESVVDLLTKRGYEHMKCPEPKPQDEFSNQLEYLITRSRIHLQAQLVMNKRDIVTVRTPYDTHEIYSKVLLAQERISQKEYDHLDMTYTGLFDTFEPPHAAIWCHASPMSALSRINMRNRGVNQTEFNAQLEAYKAFSEKIKIPLIEVDLDQTMDVIVRDFEFNVASLKATAVTSQTLWKRSFYKN